MTQINSISAWLGILCGVLSGMVGGLWFHNDPWLGGYASWRRRMVRLGHISFFGLAFINLAYAVTIRVLEWPAPPIAASGALAAGIFLMPTVCYLSAWRRGFYRLFAIPVVCVLCGVVGLLWRRVIS